MATRDFRSQQIRTTQIIASGTNPSNSPSLLIYSASAATNDQGSTNATLTAKAGSDTWLFISGSQGALDGAQVLFGGNIVISGSLSGSAYSSFPGGSINVNSDDDINFKSAGVEYFAIKNESQDEVVVNDASADIDFRVESNTLQSAIHVNANQDIVVLGRAVAPADLTAGSTPAVGTDVKVLIDGTKNSKDGSTRGIALVAGDLVVSGTLYAEKQVMEVDLSQSGNLIMSGAVHFDDLGAAPGASGQTTLAVPINDGALFVSTGSLRFRTTTDGSNFIETNVGAQYLPGLGLSGSTVGSSTTFFTDNTIVAHLTGSEFNGPVGVTGSLGVVGDLSLAQNNKLYFNGKLGDAFIHSTDGNSLDIDGDNIVNVIGDDSVVLNAGVNKTSLSPGSATINADRENVDFIVNTNNKYGTFFVDGDDETIIIGAENFDSSPAASELLAKGYTSDVKILLSGSAGSKDTPTRGVVVATGDMVISGTLYGPTGIQNIKDADQGLKNTSGIAQLDLNSMSTSGTIAVGDSIAFIDADGSNNTKKGTIADLVTAIAGDGLTNSSNQLQVGVDGSTIERSGDALRVKDAGITSAKIATAVAGDGLIGGGGSPLAVNVGPGLKIGTGGNADKVIIDDAIVATLSGSTFTGQVQFNSAITGSTDIHVGASIVHFGDNDTKIDFTTDSIKLSVGNVAALDLVENGASSEVVFNEGGNADLDFRVESNNDPKIIYVNSGFDYISIGDDAGHNSATGAQSDNHLFVSGAIGGITDGGGVDSLPGGVTLFGGDVVISGSLYDGNHKQIKLLSIAENGTFSSAPVATGDKSVAIGQGAAAGGSSGHSIVVGGLDGTASGDYSATLGGHTNTASGEYTVAMGRTNTVAGNDSVGIGRALTVPEANTIALGNSSDNAKVVVSGTLKVKSTTSFVGDVTLEETSELFVSTYIKHRGDPDTWISFNNDRIRLNTNGNNRLDINSDGQVLILSGGNSTSANPAAGTDVNFFVSGTIGSKDTAVKGTSIFGGDVHISGALSGPSQYALTDNSVRIFRDGSTMKFVDGVTSAKTLEDLSQVTATNAFIIGVEGDSSTRSKLKTTASISFAGDLNNYVTGLANPAGPTAVGTDIFFFVSGTLGAKDGAARHAALFGGDVIISGSSHLTDITSSYINSSYVKSSGDLVAGGNIIKNSNNDISIKFDSSNTNVLFGALQTGNPQTFIDIRKDDNTVYSNENTFSDFNLALRNHSTTQNAFAGIAFDVAEEEDVDRIGASVAGVRRSSDADNHQTDLVFSTNIGDNAGGVDDGLVERMRITGGGEVQISGPLKLSENNATIKDAGGNTIFSFDGSGNLDIVGAVTQATTQFTDVNISGGDLIFGNGQNATIDIAYVSGTNTAGRNLSILAGAGTGTGVGGQLEFKVAPAGGSGTSVNSHSTILTLPSTGIATFAGSIQLPNNDGIKNGDGETVLTIDADQNVAIEGDLQVKGNDIKDAGGNTALTFDGTSGDIVNAVTFSGNQIPIFANNNGVKFANDLIHDGDTDTKIRFFANKVSVEAGGLAMMLVDGNSAQKAVVFNESSGDHDFRVESNNEDHMFFVDAGTDRIGMGIAAPSTTVEIKGAAADETAIQLKDSQSSDVILKLYHANGADDGIIDLYANNSVTSRINSNGDSYFTGGALGIGTSSPGTALQVEGPDAYITLKNSTNEHTDGAAETRIIFEDHADNSLVQVEGSHDGASDDTKGKIKLKVNGGSGLVDGLTITSDKTAHFGGSLVVWGNDIASGTDADLTIRSDTHIILKVDADNDGAALVKFVNGGNAEVATVDEAGNMALGGNLKASGGAIQDAGDINALFLSGSGAVGISGSLAIHSNIIQNNQNETTITMDSDQNVILAGDLTVSGGDIVGPENGSLTIKADTDLIFQIDSDNDGTETFQFKNGAGTEIAALDESGNLQIDSDITVGGNVIRASDGGATITMDTSDNVTIGNNLTVTGLLRVTGNEIQASDGGSTITWDTSDNVTIAGDLTVGGNDIKDSGGNTILSSNGAGFIDSDLDVVGTNYSIHLVSRTSGNGTGEPIISIHTEQGTSGFSSGTDLGQVLFKGSNNSFGAHTAGLGVGGCAILAEADGTWNNADYPSRLQFLCTNDGSVSPIVRARLDHDGDWLTEGSHTSGASLFTEGHRYSSDQELEAGDTVVLVNGKIIKSTGPMQKNVAGIVFYREHEKWRDWPIHDDAGGDEDDENRDLSACNPTIIKDSFENAINRGVYNSESNEWEKTDAFKKLWKLASVGDSRQGNLVGFKICDEGGAVEPGDLLCTSSTAGYLMKQSDDIIRSYTVGKVMETVVFNSTGKATGIYGYVYCG